MEWKIKSSQIAQTLDELKAILLENRQIENQEIFFDPIDPLKLSLEQVGLDPDQMKKAIQRLQQAKKNKEDVLIFGDYDADGICATAILWEGLKQFGVIARPFIPSREKHGYGLSLRSLKAVLEEKKPDLLITVDNGVVAHTAFAELKKLGIDAILTDHHQPESENSFPEALAVVHSTQLCGSTVAWFLARELSEEAAAASLDLTAIATIADQMQMLGVSRSFVRFGLAALRETQRVGLQLLLAKANIETPQVSVNSVNYAIAPRINAMGRIKHGMDALRLLCTKNLEKADALVNELNDTNASRQDLTNEMIDHALVNAAEWENEHIIIVVSTEYHEGVIGLLAGKLAEQFHKPAIAISLGVETSKASARSVGGINITELLRLVKDDLLEVGGHPMAAGFGVLSAKVELVKTRLRTIAREQIDVELLKPRVSVECMIAPELITLDAFYSIQEFAPFGQKNSEPVFGIAQAIIRQAVPMGRKAKHLRLRVELQGEADDSRREVSCIGWGLGALAQNLKPGQQVSIAGQIDLNEWKGKTNVQIVVRDVIFQDVQIRADNDH